MKINWIKGPPTKNGIYWFIGFRSESKLNVFLTQPVVVVDNIAIEIRDPKDYSSIQDFERCNTYKEGWRELVEYHSVVPIEKIYNPNGTSHLNIFHEEDFPKEIKDDIRFFGDELKFS